MMGSATAEKHLDDKNPDQKTLCDKDELRTRFSLAISAMYKNEVPLYADLVRIVRSVNQDTSRNAEMIDNERLDLERHGAIRLGTPHELRTLRRVFALIGLYPVGYYDLSKAGLPVHATAFRPVQKESLAKNLFRMFTTLLRPELLNPEARDIALSLLLRRNIFTDELLTLTGAGEEQGGLLPEQGERFIIEAVKTFRWEAIAAATFEDFSQLQAEHPILADIACFNTSHINHLTPRTLDIEAAEARMKENGLSVKANIEGPPARRNPILLRQTSFLALQEAIKFRLKGSPDLVDGYHRARFGEIEERGAALTIKGRRLYDYILSKFVQQKSNLASTVNQDEVRRTLTQAFEEYPDDQATLIHQGLIYCTFRTTQKAAISKLSYTEGSASLSVLLGQGVLEAEPLTYEDFLPLSAAGIFMSNLHVKKEEQKVRFESYEDREGLESILGCRLLDSDTLYSNAQEESLRVCAGELCLDRIIVDY